MRFQAVFLLAIALSVASSNAFFLKKAKALPATLAAVKLNLVADAKAAVANLKEAGHLKVKAVTGGIKAVGTAKLGVLKGIKAAKIDVLKGIAGAKLAKVAAIKAGKLAFAKTLIAAKLVPVVASGVKIGALKGAVAARPLGHSLIQGLKGQSASGSSGGLTSLSSSALFGLLGSALSATSSKTSSRPSGSLLPDFGSILAQIGGSGNLALFPAPSVVPTHVNIVTYKSDATSGQSSASGNNGYQSRPIIDERSKAVSAAATSYEAPVAQTKNVPAPATTYGAAITETKKVPAPATKYGAPVAQTPIVSTPVTSYGTPIRAIPPSTSYGYPILR